MKKVNANMPAMPTSELDSLTHRDDGFDESGRYLTSNGLTKREMFAMHVMASAIGGVMANPDPQANATPNDTAELAVCYADALLKELEK
ncbi:hypothetical protein NVP1284A_54 [Vibrio phage 1.284.A._10N.286.55.A5]|nr:hypothetical protein NVP1284A_54 [Vibrio phage 1.284.A._10N.286.55.A5]AUS01627.1 hypothetical protein NVP1287O_54 [Vibrio phage 1.287.O._10N.286.55.C7]AUS01697.1 hypothetical protein NVP1289A_53 [Vibrio phage 1.289.A._10N.286.55.E8]